MQSLAGTAVKRWKSDGGDSGGQADGAQGISGSLAYEE